MSFKYFWLKDLEVCWPVKYIWKITLVHRVPVQVAFISAVYVFNIWKVAVGTVSMFHPTWNEETVRCLKPLNTTTLSTFIQQARVLQRIIILVAYVN